MSVASCFWALLSLENFDFIYLPDFITDTQIGFGKTPGDILLHNSLLQFIHPDELSLAKTDLMNFVQIKTLAGAVTRCRLKSVKSIIYQEYGECHNMSNRLEDWIITDVVMYTATNNTILTFFHSHEIENSDNTTTVLPISYCGSRQFHLHESNSILKTLQIQSLPMKIEDPCRIFEIYDTQSKQLIISCPSCLYKLEEFDSIDDRSKLIKSASELANTLTLREMDKRIQYPQLKADAACTHHSHSNSTAILEPYGLCQVETIIITYGSLTFSTYQVTPVIENKNNRASSYHHYMHCTPTTNGPSSAIIEYDRTNKSTNKFKRKSNINDILNNTASSNSSSHSNPNQPLLLQQPRHDNSNIVSSLPSSSTTTTTLLPLLHQTSSINNNNNNSHDIHYIPKKYNDNNNNANNINITIDTESTEKSKIRTSTSSSTTKISSRSPLPRAWRGRFGAYEKKCENCQTNTSPEWRRGPSGHKTLCNACGLRYARLVAKHERQQAPKEEQEEDRSPFTTTHNKLKNSNMTKKS